MAPRPYSERTSLPDDAEVCESVTSVPPQVLPESPSPSTLGSTRTPSPIPQEILVTSPLSNFTEVQEGATELIDSVPCYPTPDDIMPYDHSLPDFIRQITNQPNLTNLQKLNLRVISNLISLHRMASYLPNLRELDLEGSVLNSLRDIGCGLKNLQILKVGRCQLESLDGTFGLASLRELYAQKNYINDVSPCSNLPHIRHIDVSGNRIRNISYAGFLSVCSKLKSIVFTGNPATEVTDYRKHVQRILPQIETLDGLPLYSEETGEEFKKTDSIDNLSENSVDVPDYLSTSPSGSMINFLDYEDDSFPDEKISKEATNISHSLNLSDCEVPKTLTNQSPEYDFQEFPNFCFKINEAEINERENFNVEKKIESLQKLDKYQENSSKKLNFFLIKNMNENGETSLFAEKKQMSKTSSDDSILLQNNSKGKNIHLKKTNLQRSLSTSNETLSKINNEMLTSSEAVKKRPLNTFLNSVKDVCGGKFQCGQLTTGAPVCGNLAAALRNRKKIQYTWNEKDQSKSQTIHSPKEAKSYKNGLLVQLKESIDSGKIQFVANEDNFIKDDVLICFQEGREKFSPNRSNNRAVLESENQIDCSRLLGESLKEDLKDVKVYSKNENNS